MDRDVLPTPAPGTSREPGRPWLAVDDNGEAVRVRVRGGASADRSDDLWSALEGALHQAVGRPVIVDLAQVTGFDVNTIATLLTISKAASRWHLDLRAVIEPRSAIDDYMRSCGVSRLLPSYGTEDEALTAINSVATSWSSNSGKMGFPR